MEGKINKSKFIAIMKVILLSFVFAYNGGVLQLNNERISLHTAQLFLAILGFILSFNLNYIKNTLKINRKFLWLFFLLIVYFQFHVSNFTPIYSNYKISLLWWNLIVIFILITSIKNLNELKLLIIIGVIQITLGVLINGIDLSSFRTGAGEAISSGRLGGILFAFGLLYPDRKLKLLRIIIGFLGFLFILLSGTRTLYISFALILLFFLLFDHERGKFKISFKTIKTGAIILSGVTGLIIVINLNIFNVNIELVDRFYSAFESLNQFVPNDPNRSIRSTQWELAVDEWKDRPIFGLGLGGFAYSWSKGDIRMYPHNIFFELLSEGGIIAIVFFLKIVMTLWKILRKNAKKTPYQLNKFLFSLFLLGLISSMTSLEFPNQFILFLSMALIVTVNNILYYESNNFYIKNSN